MEVNPSTRLGKYHLTRHLAHGGMSDIYLAHKENTVQLYAIKVVKQNITSDYQHLRREMAILNTLKHDHILPIFDYQEGEDGIAYYVTPYIEQGSLKERLSHGTLSPEEAATILNQVGDALQFIHKLGLVHRDIKPANILLDETNHVWLADFGLAKELNVPGDLTDSSCLLGTPYYIAPELLEGPASNSSDIYALGVVLYEMLTGTPPFTGPTPLAICWQHVYALPPLPSALNPCISAAVEQVILQALEKAPGERFSSAHALVEAYEDALLSPTSIIRPQDFAFKTAVPVMLGDTLIKAKPRWLRVAALSQQRQRRPLAVAMVMMVLLFALSITTLAIEFQIQPPTIVRANAQMISLPEHPSPTRPITPRPTAKPKPKPTPTSNTATNPTDDQGNGSGKHHKQKHHGKDGE